MALSRDRFDAPQSADPTPAPRSAVAMRTSAAPPHQPRRSLRPPTARDAQSEAIRPPRRVRRSIRAKGALNAVVMTLAMALFATIAIPSYAFDPAANAEPEFAESEVEALKATDSQTLQVAANVADATVTRDNIGATSQAELDERKRIAEEAAAAAAAAAEAEARRAQLATSYGSYSGPSAGDYVSSPAYPSFSLGGVYQVALQYQGVPYVYGGSNPSGFDCSGFVMFVYAQFGVSLAHSVRSQAASGTQISAADAQPGDLVVWSDGSHDGIYAGNGRVVHAPYPGTAVREQPLWGSYYFVRLGI